jgi:hypothetical protein
MKEKKDHSNNSPTRVNKAGLIEKRDQLLEELYEFELYRKKMLLQYKRSSIAVGISAVVLISSLVGFWLDFNKLIDHSFALTVSLWICFGIGFLAVLISLAGIMLSKSDLHSRSKQEFFPKLLNISYPQLKYTAHQHIDMSSLWQWPYLDHFEDVYVEAGQDHLEGFHAGMHIELAEMQIAGASKNYEFPISRTDNSTIFKGILILIKNIPKTSSGIEISQQKNIIQEIERMGKYWGMRPQIKSFKNDYVLISIQTDRPFLEVSHKRKDSVYKEEILERYYNDLDHCLHLIELLAQEIQ